MPSLQPACAQERRALERACDFARGAQQRCRGWRRAALYSIASCRLACKGHQLTHSQAPSSLQAFMHATAVGAVAVALRTLSPPNQTLRATINVSAASDRG